MQNKPNLIKNNDTGQPTTTVRKILVQTFLPLVVWQVIIAKNFSPLQKYQSYLKQHTEIVAFHFIEMENNVREEMLRLQKELNRHLVENNIEPIVSFEEYSLQINSTTKNSVFRFGIYLLRVLTRYFIKKTIKDLFTTQLGLRLVGLLFLTFLAEGVIQKSWQPLERSVPSFSVVRPKLSLETFFHITHKETNPRSALLNQAYFEDADQSSPKPVVFPFKERINQFQRGDQTSWGPPIKSATLVSDSIMVEINEVWNAAHKQMYQGVFKDQPNQLADTSKPTPRWYQLSPRRYMGIVPTFPKNHHPAFPPEAGGEAKPVKIDLSSALEKQRPVQGVPSSEGLTDWLKRFYFEMDELPLYLSTQFNKTKHFSNPAVFRQEEVCLLPPPSSFNDLPEVPEVTEGVLNRWSKRWSKHYAPDLTYLTHFTNLVKKNQPNKDQLNKDQPTKDQKNKDQPTKDQVENTKIQTVDWKNVWDQMDQPKFRRPDTLPPRSIKIHRLSHILLNTRGIKPLETTTGPLLPRGLPKKVFLPRLPRDPNKLKLEVRVQDPFPEWFPKWLHWLQYLGFRRPRTLVSLDDLIPIKVAERFGVQDVPAWGSEDEEETVSIDESKPTNQNLVSSNEQLALRTHQIKDLKRKGEILYQMLSRMKQVKKKRRLTVRHRFLRKQQKRRNSQRQTLYALNLKRVGPEYWTVAELTRLKRSIKEIMFSSLLNPFFKTFEERNSLELKEVSQTFSKEVPDLLIEAARADENKAKQLAKRKQSSKRKQSYRRKQSDVVLSAWVQKFQPFTDKARLESRSKLNEKLTLFDHKIDQIIDPVIDSLELYKSAACAPPSNLRFEKGGEGLKQNLRFDKQAACAAQAEEPLPLEQNNLVEFFSFSKQDLLKVLPSRRMSGYAYPDMETGELKAISLQSLYRRLPQKLYQLKWKKATFDEGYKNKTFNPANLSPEETRTDFMLPSDSVFQVDLPSTLLSLSRWLGHKNSNPCIDCIDNSPNADPTFLETETSEEREKKRKKRFRAGLNSQYEVDQKNREEVDKWLQRHLNTDNPASDLKQALLEWELRRHIYNNRLTEHDFDQTGGGVSEIPEESSTKITKMRSVEPGVAAASHDPTTNEGGSEEHEGSFGSSVGDETTVGEATARGVELSDTPCEALETIDLKPVDKSRVGGWLVPPAWDFRPWLPTLDAVSNDVIASVPPEVLTRCLLIKKPFIDAVFEGLVESIEKSFKEVAQEPGEQLLPLPPRETILNLFDASRLGMKKVSRNELMRLFLPRVYYRRLRKKTNPLERVAPLLDYASPLKGFQNYSQNSSKGRWYQTTNGLHQLRQFGEQEVMPIYDWVSSSTPPFLRTPTEKVTLWPYSEGVLQEGSMGVDVVGGSYNKRAKLLYSSSDLNLPFRIVNKVLSTLQRLRLSIIVPEELLKRDTRPDLWEPLTSHSWLVVYKVGYVWLCCNLLSDFYKRYVRQSLFELVRALMSIGQFNEDIIAQLGLEPPEDPSLNSRTFTNLKTRFSDIAAIDNLIPVLGEIVWFLRNRGRGSKTLNKGVLMVGPPGTGKTFLVQAVGGESKVPVLAQSGSTFYNLNDPDKVAASMRKLFHKAQQIAPCILFVDEIDSLGSTRGKPSGDEEEIIRRNKPLQIENVFRGYANLEDNVLYRMNSLLLSEIDLHRFGANREAELKEYIEMLDAGITGQLAVYGGPVESNTARKDAIFARSLNREHDRQELNYKKANLLLTFLTQLDGVKPRRGVLVVGATNRADTLDPAFLRPGRFDQVIHLTLPGKNKRIEIFKFYSHRLGVDKTLREGYWEYLANRTVGWSIADLAVAINQSAMLAIIKDTTHTIETMENGIETVIHSGEKVVFTPPKQNKDPFFASRRGFYQAAKAIVQYLLPDHPPAVVLHLFPQPTNTRENRRTNNNDLNVKLNGFQPRKTLENRLVGLYAGKAGELLHLIETSSTSKNRLRDRLTEAVVYRNKKISNLRFENKNRNLPLFSGGVINRVSNLRFGSTSSGSVGTSLKLVQEKAKREVKGFLPFLSTVQSSQNLGEFLSFYKEKLPSFLSVMGSSGPSVLQIFDLIKASPCVPEEVDLASQKRRTFNSERDKLLQTVFLRYSELGYEDLKTASGLAAAMIEKWHLYSNALAIHKRNAVIPDLNRQEQKKAVYPLSYMEEISSELEDELAVPPNVWHPLKRYQIWHAPAYYLDGAVFQLDFRKKVRDWYRIYLPNREQTKWNVDWVPPDAYYHGKETLKGITSPDHQMQCTLNCWYGIRRDYLYRGLILNAFCKALLIVHNNRELLDLFAHHLLRHGILRQPEVETVMEAFGHQQQTAQHIYD